jgi:ABC-type multidrug transport system fused ATPase/permease subunit
VVTVTSGISALLPFARPAWILFTAAGVVGAAAALLSLVPYWAIYRTIDELLTGDPARDDLWRLSLIALVAIIAR